MTDNAQRIAELERKLQARQGQPGMKANVEAIQAEIARLKAEDDRRTSEALKQPPPEAE